MKIIMFKCQKKEMQLGWSLSTSNQTLLRIRKYSTSCDFCSYRCLRKRKSRPIIKIIMHWNSNQPITHSFLNPFTTHWMRRGQTPILMFILFLKKFRSLLLIHRLSWRSFQIWRVFYSLRLTNMLSLRSF